VHRGADGRIASEEDFARRRENARAAGCLDIVGGSGGFDEDGLAKVELESDCLELGLRWMEYRLRRERDAGEGIAGEACGREDVVGGERERDWRHDLYSDCSRSS
jgi:hypothetical protein